MSSEHVFISHATKDGGFVKELREALETHGIAVWVDSRELIGGNKLAPEIERAITEARQFIAVFSPNTINSPWAVASGAAVTSVLGESFSTGGSSTICSEMMRRLPLLSPVSPMKRHDLPLSSPEAMSTRNRSLYGVRLQCPIVTIDISLLRSDECASLSVRTLRTLDQQPFART